VADAWFVLSNAIVIATIYGTLAIGISITWSSLGLLNLAYGFVFAFAGYGAWLVAEYISPWGGAVLAGGILAGARVAS
jgi:branched-chain amino acid transport system permease protein